MILAQFEDAYILDKPAGITTHTPDGGVTFGFCEMAEQLLGQKLWAVHRLDRDTSGCLLVTTKPGSVAPWTEKLKNGVKRYVFISPHKSKKESWSIEGRIEKIHTKRFRLVDGESNSFTKFRRLGACELGYFYEALISSGKTHQIRIHAEKSGVPVLGCSEHGGDTFERLMLHAESLELDGIKTCSNFPKLFKAGPSSTQDDRKLLLSLDRRRFLFDFEKDTDCFRIVHREWTANLKPRLSVEKLGQVAQFLNYSPTNLPKTFLEETSRAIGAKHWCVRIMNDRGQTGSTEEGQPSIHLSKTCPTHFSVIENDIKFELRLDQGQSSGLFLDQRANRKYVKHNTKGKKVANLFSYTCGFSVAAALGGATEVVSVDSSKASLDWGRRNFEINGLKSTDYEFFDTDAELFLDGCIKRNRQFDIIILDPPTFGRSRQGLFRLEDSLSSLIKKSLICLSDNGEMLLTINNENIAEIDLKEAVNSLITKADISAIVSHAPRSWDFEFPNEKPAVLKGFWIRKTK